MIAAALDAPTLFSGDLRPFPGIPASWTGAKRDQAEAILADVDAAFPDMLGDLDPDADIEDFWEDACRVSAAWRASGGNVVAKDSWRTRERWSPDEMLRRLGPVASSEEGGSHALDREIGHPLVHEHGGRGLKRGSLLGDPATDIVRWLAARHRDHGVARGVVKLAERKKGIWSIELDSDPEVVKQRLLDAMDWTFIRLEGLEGAIFAQDAIDLQWEYRLFIVDGVVVSGAGCVEEFTPLDRAPEEGPFGTRVRRIRGHLHQGRPSAVEDRPEIVARLIEFGRRVAAEHGGTVVIDVALDAAASLDGTPVVIELNELPNSGLYASDPWLVTRALMTAADRGYTSLIALPEPANPTPFRS